MLIFVVAMGSFMVTNATTIIESKDLNQTEEELVFDCFDACDMMAEIIGDLEGLDHAEEHVVFEMCFSVC